MSHTMTPSHALALLREQHQRIVELADHLDTAAASLRDDDDVTGEVAVHAARLRIALTAHNRDEDALLDPILLATDAFGPVRVAAMRASHDAEHGAMVEALGTPTVSALRAATRLIRAHLAGEERTFLSHRVVRDDVITVEDAG